MSVVLSTTQTLIRYISEWDPREAAHTKGGYLEGAITLPPFTGTLRSAHGCLASRYFPIIFVAAGDHDHVLTQDDRADLPRGGRGPRHRRAAPRAAARGQDRQGGHLVTGRTSPALSRASGTRSWSPSPPTSTGARCSRCAAAAARWGVGVTAGRGGGGDPNGAAAGADPQQSVRAGREAGRQLEERAARGRGHVSPG